MSFAGKVWRLLVGIKDAFALIFLLLFFYALFAILSLRPNPAQIHEGALLLNLDGSVVEEVAPIDPIALVLSSAVPTREYAARDLVHAIDAAAQDERILAIAMDLSTFLGGGQVHMKEIGEALDRFRRTEKPVLAYAVAYSDDSVMLAAHADEVWVDPLGGAAIRGPGGENVYYADLFERFGINIEVFRVGTYKSAVEPYTRNSMSDEARENLQAIYGSLWEEWQADVKRARPQADIDLATGDVGAWLAASDGNLAQAAIDAGLADRAGTYAEWGERIAEIAGRDPWTERPGAFATTELGAWLQEIGPGSARSGFIAGPASIGVVTIAGEISDGNASPGSAGAARIEQILDDALNNGLSGLVVRVNSPGGTVTGSETIRRAILRHKAKGIPIAISMANMAASGGYWISTTGDRIFAEPETITGSIGVFGILPTFENILSEYGVTTDGVRTTPLSGQPDILAGLTPEARTVLQTTVESNYDTFLSLVSQSRGISMERADELGQGRVWDGGTARQLGLVDQFGDFDTALAWTAAQAGHGEGEWSPVFLGKPAPAQQWIGRILGLEAEQVRGRDMLALFARQQEDLLGRALNGLEGLVETRGTQALCLECPIDSPASAPGTSEAAGLRGWIARILLR